MNDFEAAKRFLVDWKPESKSIISEFMGVKIQEFEKEDLIAMVCYLGEELRLMRIKQIEDIIFMQSLYEKGKVCLSNP